MTCITNSKKQCFASASAFWFGANMRTVLNKIMTLRINCPLIILWDGLRIINMYLVTRTPSLHAINCSKRRPATSFISTSTIDWIMSDYVWDPQPFNIRLPTKEPSNSRLTLDWLELTLESIFMDNSFRKQITDGGRQDIGSVEAIRSLPCWQMLFHRIKQHAFARTSFWPNMTVSATFCIIHISCLEDYAIIPVIRVTLNRLIFMYVN